MNRRNFIKKILVIAVVCTGAMTALLLKRKSFTPLLTNAEKEQAIAKALNTPEGKDALAKAVARAIRDIVEYDENGKLNSSKEHEHPKTKKENS